MGANQLSSPDSELLNWLVIGSAPSKKSRSAPEVFRAGHNGDMTDTGNRARKTSGTQGKGHDVEKNFLSMKQEGMGVGVSTAHA